MNVSIEDQIDEQMNIRRQFRQAVPRMVKEGKITQAAADNRIARQEAALKTLQYVATHKEAFLQAVKTATRE